MGYGELQVQRPTGLAEQLGAGQDTQKTARFRERKRSGMDRKEDPLGTTPGAGLERVDFLKSNTWYPEFFSGFSLYGAEEGSTGPRNHRRETFHAWSALSIQFSGYRMNLSDGILKLRRHDIITLLHDLRATTYSSRRNTMAKNRTAPCLKTRRARRICGMDVNEIVERVMLRDPWLADSDEKLQQAVWVYEYQLQFPKAPRPSWDTCIGLAEKGELHRGKTIHDARRKLQSTGVVRSVDPAVQCSRSNHQKGAIVGPIVSATCTSCGRRMESHTCPSHGSQGTAGSCRAKANVAPMPHPADQDSEAVETAA